MIPDQVVASTPTAAGGTREVIIEEGWDTIGGVPNGTYLLSLALRAASESFPGMAPLTLTGHFLRPAAKGPAELTVAVVRQGQRLATASVGLVQEGKERVRALMTFGPASVLDGDAVFTPPAPQIPQPAQCAVPSNAPAAALGATIAQRYEYRVVPPSRWLGEPSGEPKIDAWIRLADGSDPDLTALVLFNDAFPAPVLEVAEGMAPTIELTVHVRRRPVPGWIQARATSRLFAGGLVEQDVDLWDEQGRLVAMSRQLLTFVPVTPATNAGSRG